MLPRPPAHSVISRPLTLQSGETFSTTLNANSFSPPVPNTWTQSEGVVHATNVSNQGWDSVDGRMDGWMEGCLSGETSPVTGNIPWANSCKEELHKGSKRGHIIPRNKPQHTHFSGRVEQKKWAATRATREILSPGGQHATLHRGRAPVSRSGNLLHPFGSTCYILASQQNIWLIFICLKSPSESNNCGRRVCVTRHVFLEARVTIVYTEKVTCVVKAARKSSLKEPWLKGTDSLV